MRVCGLRTEGPLRVVRVVPAFLSMMPGRLLIVTELTAGVL